MKLAVAVVCFMAFATFAQGLFVSEIIKAVRECKKANDCNENILQMLNDHEIPKTQAGLKSMYCAGEKIGMIMPDNQIDTEIMKTCLEKLHMDKDKIPQVVADCQSKCTGADQAEAAKSLLTCIKNHQSN